MIWSSQAVNLERFNRFLKGSLATCARNLILQTNIVKITRG